MATLKECLSALTFAGLVGVSGYLYADKQGQRVHVGNDSTVVRGNMSGSTNVRHAGTAHAENVYNFNPPQGSRVRARTKNGEWEVNVDPVIPESKPTPQPSITTQAPSVKAQPSHAPDNSSGVAGGLYQKWKDATNRVLYGSDGSVSTEQEHRSQYTILAAAREKFDAIQRLLTRQFGGIETTDLPTVYHQKLCARLDRSDGKRDYIITADACQAAYMKLEDLINNGFPDDSPRRLDEILEKI